jgi:hypothetical protein
MNLNDCFDTMLEYGEAIKSSFVKGHVSDWPEKEEEEIVTPEEPKAEEPETTDPKEPGIPGGVIEEPVEEEGEL